MRTLKQAMKVIPTLTLTDFGKKFFVEADALGAGVEAVLSQEGRPITIFNQAL